MSLDEMWSKIPSNDGQSKAGVSRLHEVGARLTPRSLIEPVLDLPSLRRARLALPVILAGYHCSYRRLY